MNCRRVEQLLSDHLEGLLSPRASRAVAAHLRDCPACHRLREEYLSVLTRMRDLAEQLPDPGPEIERRSIERWFADRKPAQGIGRRPFLPGAMAAPPMRGWRLRPAAAATLALAALGLTLVRWHDRGSPGQPAPAFVQRPHSGRPAPVPTPRPPSLPGERRIAVSPPYAAGSADKHTLAAGPSLASGAEKPARSQPALPSGPRGRHPGAEHLQAWNGTPGAPPRPWRTGSRDEWDQVEAQVRGAVPVRDDFVHIPFPRLATTSDRQIAQAVKSYKREAAVVDTRLAREVTLAFKATALSDLCGRLRADTGIRLEAGASVADEKVTLFCRKRSLREVMRQLTRPFGYAWLRSGSPSPSGSKTTAGTQPPPLPVGEGAGGRGYRYELVQDLRSQLLEEELRNQARNEALLALDREMQCYRPYLMLSPDEALARSKTAPAGDKKLLENLAGRGWGAIQMYFRISPRDLDTLRAGHGLSFSQDPQKDDQLLPPEVARGVLQSMRDVRLRGDRGGEGGAVIGNAEQVPDGVPPASFPEARARVSLRFGHSELGQFTFDGQGGVYVGTRITIGGSDYATGTSSATRDPNNAAAHAPLAREPSLNLRVTVKPEPSCGPDPSPSPSPTGRGETVPANGDRHPSPRRGGGGGGVPDPKATTADVLEALHRATGLPIAADAYTRLFPLPRVSLQNMTLFDALNELADTMRLRWHREKEGGWLQFRSVSYFDDRLKEVPNRLLFRWAASRQKHGALTLDDLIEIAGLTDVQLDSPTMAEGARDCFDLVEWALVRNQQVRPHLRYLATLTPAQREVALSIEGLPFARLSLAQQQQLLAHLGGRLEWIHIQSLEQLSAAAVRVEYTQPGGFRWLIPGTVRRADEHGPPSRLDLLRGGMFGLSPVRERTREATLQAARRVEPSVDATQIAPTDLALAVVYMLTDPTTSDLMPLGTRGGPNNATISW